MNGPFTDPEKTPAEGPFALHLARIEGKLDLVIQRQDHALNAAFEARETARRALFARTTWAPYALGSAALVGVLTLASYVLAHAP